MVVVCCLSNAKLHSLESIKRYYVSFKKAFGAKVAAFQVW